MNNTSQVLDNLKKSRKLIPSKIRSISNKNNDNKVKDQETTNNQRYQINFGWALINNFSSCFILFCFLF